MVRPQIERDTEWQEKVEGLISKFAVIGAVGVGAVIIAGIFFGVPLDAFVGDAAAVATAIANVGITFCPGDCPHASAGSCAVAGCSSPLLLPR